MPNPQATPATVLVQTRGRKHDSWDRRGETDQKTFSTPSLRLNQTKAVCGLHLSRSLLFWRIYGHLPKLSLLQNLEIPQPNC